MGFSLNAIQQEKDRPRYRPRSRCHGKSVSKSIGCNRSFDPDCDFDLHRHKQIQIGCIPCTTNDHRQGDNIMVAGENGGSARHAWVCNTNPRGLDVVRRTHPATKWWAMPILHAARQTKSRPWPGCVMTSASGSVSVSESKRKRCAVQPMLL